MNINPFKKIGSNPLSDDYINLAPRAFQHKLSGIKNPVIIDVRSPEEFEKDSIPNAINISYQADNFWDRVVSYKNESFVFIYSQTGRKSKRACILLRNGGFDKEQIFNLDGGFRSWKKSRI